MTDSLEYAVNRVLPKLKLNEIDSVRHKTRDLYADWMEDRLTELSGWPQMSLGQ